MVTLSFLVFIICKHKNKLTKLIVLILLLRSMYAKNIYNALPAVNLKANEERKLLKCLEKIRLP